MPSELIAPEYAGWWRIVENGTWVNDGLDALGPALISFAGRADRLRMHCLPAHVNARFTRGGISFTWTGAWECDQVSGTGSVRLGRDGHLKGKIKIRRGLLFRRRRRHGDVAERQVELFGGEPCPSGAPVLGRELEVPIARPVGDDADDLREKRLGIEVVELAGRDQREDVARGAGVVVGAVR